MARHNRNKIQTPINNIDKEVEIKKTESFSHDNIVKLSANKGNPRGDWRIKY